MRDTEVPLRRGMSWRLLIQIGNLRGNFPLEAQDRLMIQFSHKAKKIPGNVLLKLPCSCNYKYAPFPPLKEQNQLVVQLFISHKVHHVEFNQKSSEVWLILL